jgi:NAD(P)-dependent dehydrogenase (short-subunit alcohol dehydrogenase family)
MRNVLIAATLILGTLSVQTVQAATVLITGSNRGLGLEFAKQYAEDGWDVIATCRTPERADDLKALAEKHKNLFIERLDVLDEGEIAALTEKYKGKPIDLLINNAGVLGDIPSQTFGNVDRRTFDFVLGTNVYGAISVTEAFKENVVASDQKKIVALTSLMGSTSMAGPGHTFYRASKAALGMSMRVIAGHLRNDGVTVGVIAPCVADTDMLEEIGYSGPLTISAEEAVGGMRQVISDLDQESARKPINCDGKPFEW